MLAAHDSWWDGVRPLMVNEDAPLPKEIDADVIHAVEDGGEHGGWAWLKSLVVRVAIVHRRLFAGTFSTEFSPPKGLGWRSAPAGSVCQRSSTTKRYS